MDSYLYLIMAREKLGLDESNLVENALALNPSNKPTIIHAIMSYLAQLNRLSKQQATKEEKAVVVRRLQETIRANQYSLFIRQPLA